MKHRRPTIYAVYIYRRDMVGCAVAYQPVTLIYKAKQVTINF